MIEPILSFALSMHANPGVYALLVGSGVSRSAGIPTGWEIVLDLCRKLAAMLKKDCEPDPAVWYHDEFGKDPEYSELLNAIGKSPAERQQLLRSYFEPTDNEREQGLKQPTAAHRAIAKLVVDGCCRVVLTTNFDRLIERAIEDKGVSPVVLSTPDSLEGALPLAHQRCCVVKLHGDYLDTRIKNTPAELGSYDERQNQFLDQILDDFGLVVCGWSAQWDTALRTALERCVSRRFTMYWAARGKLTAEAARLVKQRSGEVIPIEDADSFFRKLAEQVAALKESRRLHPASVEAAVALTKRYLSDPRHRIELEDLVTDEMEAAHGKIEALSEAVLNAPNSPNKVEDCFRDYRMIVESLQAMLIQGAVFGTGDHDHLWVDAVERIRRYTKEDRNVLKPAVRPYPALLLLQGCGVAAMSRQRYKLVARLLMEPKLRQHGQVKPLLLGFNLAKMHGNAKTLSGYKNEPVPLSEHLFDVLREPLLRVLPDDQKYDECFDRFEYLRALVYADLENPQLDAAKRFWIPCGRFCWKAHRSPETNVLKQFRAELDHDNEEWPPIRAGMFGGRVARAEEIMAGAEEFVRGLCMW